MPCQIQIGPKGWCSCQSLILAQENSPARVDVAISNHPCESLVAAWHRRKTSCVFAVTCRTTLTAAFLVNADVEPIKSVPVAIFKGTDDAMMDEKALDDVEEILKKNLSADKLLVQRFPGA